MILNMFYKTQMEKAEFKNSFEKQIKIIVSTSIN